MKTQIVNNERLAQSPFDCVVIMEVIDTCGRKKTLTALVNREDEWGGYTKANDIIDFVGARLLRVIREDSSATVVKGSAFAYIEDSEGKMGLALCYRWLPYNLITNTYEKL